MKNTVRHHSIHSARSIIEVSTGEVKTGGSNAMLVASALGSCIAVAALDRDSRRGGMAHVMLPGRSAAPDAIDRFRYAENAIDELLRQLGRSASERDRITIIIAGGGNVLRRTDDRVCEQNIRCVVNTLVQRGFTVQAQSLGGNLRRRLQLDIGAGCAVCSEGDGPGQVLWQESGPPSAGEPV